MENASKTILLRGTSADITLEALQQYFEQFGQIERMDLTIDHHRPTHVNILERCSGPDQTCRR